MVPARDGSAIGQVLLVAVLQARDASVPGATAGQEHRGAKVLSNNRQGPHGCAHL